MPTPVEIGETDHRIPVAGGAVFARSWTPALAEAAPAEAGSAKAAPILLFHDSLGCVELWRTFPARLAAATNRRVIAYDRLGFGRSDPHPGRLAPDFIAAEARDAVPLLCDALGLTAFIACGHSIGGGMAVETAAQFQSRCLALVTIAAQSFVEDVTLAGIRQAQADFRVPAAIDRLARYHGTKARWVADAWTQTWLDPSFASWTLDRPLSTLRCPVLVIHGERDEYGSLAQARRIAGGRAALEVLPGVGHVPHRHNESGLIEVMRAFLAVRA